MPSIDLKIMDWESGKTSALPGALRSGGGRGSASELILGCLLPRSPVGTHRRGHEAHRRHHQHECQDSAGYGQRVVAERIAEDDDASDDAYQVGRACGGCDYPYRLADLQTSRRGEKRADSG